MALDVEAVRDPSPLPAVDDVASAGSLAIQQALPALGVNPDGGLSSEQVLARREKWGSNAVASHRARFWPVLWHQLRSPLLALLLTAAIASYFVGERSDALIISAIVCLSVG